MKRIGSILAVLVVTGSFTALRASDAVAPTVWETPAIVSDTVWSGDIVLRQSVTVSEGVTLRIAPGTSVRVEADREIALSVLGRLVVAGTAAAPVVFVPEKGATSRNRWEGVRLAGGQKAGHVLEFFRLSGGREGVSLTDTKARVTGGVLTGCKTGIRAQQKSHITIDNCAFDGNDAGVVVSLGGEATVRDSRFSDILANGIVADKGASLSVANCDFSRGKAGIFSLTNSPCRIAGSRFASLEKGIVARQMGVSSSVTRCTFENNGTGVLAVQFCALEVSDSAFQGNQTAMDVQEFSTPRVRYNRFERNQVAVNLFRKCHAVVEGNVFHHNRSAIVVNYSSYPRIAQNNFDRNDMSIRLEKFQSGDWEERVGSPSITGGEVVRRGGRNPNRENVKALGQNVFPKQIAARGNYWGPDSERDPAKGTLGKIWDGKKYGPVRYEGFGEEEYRIDVVDFSEESEAPVPGAGPRIVVPAKEAK